MVSPLKAFETDYAELHAFLLENNQLSMANFLENHSRKIYLLSCASYYENQITRILEQFIRSHTDDERLAALAMNCAVNRKYHTYFNWDQTSSIGSFLGLFGSDFKVRIQAEIKKDPERAQQIEAFLIIGQERNKMMHRNYLEYTLEKTFPELRELNARASAFLQWLGEVFDAP